MRTYVTSAARVTTVRKEDYYPSGRTATFLARRVCYVLGRTTDRDIEACASTLNGNVVPALACGYPKQNPDAKWEYPVDALGWSPADVSAVKQLILWWSYDAESLSSGGFDKEETHRFLSGAYVLVDLNTGRSLVIVDR